MIALRSSPACRSKSTCNDVPVVRVGGTAEGSRQFFFIHRPTHYHIHSYCTRGVFLLRPGPAILVKPIRNVRLGSQAMHRMCLKREPLCTLSYHDIPSRPHPQLVVPLVQKGK